MRHGWRAGIALAAVLAGPAQAQREGLPADVRGRIDSAVTRYMAARQIPGLSIAVVTDGKAQWSAGYGMADLEELVPATSATLYRLASISKSLTATATMRLWERGGIDLDAPVQRYCPAFPGKPWPITTRELLGHLGGIRHYHMGAGESDPEIGNTTHFAEPMAAGVAFVANDTLIAPPGTKFSYSTHGYTLVGCAMEGATGRHYADLVREAVLTPGGMTHTVADDRFAIIPDRTRFYSHDSTGHVINADFLDSDYKLPGGGWLSSADDMARFAVALLQDKLMRRSTRDLMWTQERTTGGMTVTYGLGWAIDTLGGVTRVSHSGGQQGTSTLLVIVPSRNAAIVTLANVDNVDLWTLSNGILDMLARYNRNR